MTSVLWLSATLAYLAAGLVFARGRLRQWHRTDEYGFLDDGMERGLAVFVAVLLGLIWPLSVTFLKFRDWMWRPVDKEQERVAQLRSDLAAWSKKANDLSATEQERQAARDIIAVLDDLLRATK